MVHRFEERRFLFGCDGVLDGHQDGSGVGLGVEGQSRRRPIHDGLGVEVTGLWHPPDHSSDDAGKHDEGRDQECGLQAQSFGHKSPKQRLRPSSNR